MKYIIIGILLLISINLSAEPIDLSEPLTEETFAKWDSYIKRNAPSNAAMQVVITIANRHFFMGRAAVSREIYKMYIEYFPEQKDWFKQQIEYNEIIMLSQAPQHDIFWIFHQYIVETAPSENAFVAVQRISEPFIFRKDWDSAAFVYRMYQEYFPSTKERFAKIIEIIEADSEEAVIRNLGNNINTEYDEWDPVPTPDGRFLYFSTRNRPDGFGNSDVYYSELKEGRWQNAKNLGKSVNGPNDETIDNVTVDGTGLLLSGTFPGTFGKFDIYYIERTQDGWSSLQHFPMPINSEYVDEGACMTADGKAIIFTSDRPGGIGEFVPFGTIVRGSVMGNMDLYVSIKTDTGWSQPINLGTTINTPYAERSPYLHPDGRTLYFSSDGHPGLGRLDVFKAVRLKEDSWTEWSEPINLGKDINTVNDDWGYKVSLSGDSAFFAGHNYPLGYGGWDLYSVRLPERMRPEKVVTIRGTVTNSNGEPIAARIVWEDLESQKIVGELRSNPNDGSYIIVLPLGKNYGFFAEKDNYYPISNSIDLRNISEQQNIMKNIVLISKKDIIDSKFGLVINNVFFDFDNYSLKNESYSELHRLADFINEQNPSKIIIQGHTDNIGTNEYNQILSEKRAISVRDFLIRLVKSNIKFEVIGFGASRPISDNDTEEGRAKNRRVEILFEK